MIICLCHAVTDEELLYEIGKGASTIDDIEEACGAGSGCGICKEEIQEILDREVGDGSGRGRALLHSK